MKQIQQHRKYMADKHQIPIKIKQSVGSTRDHIPNLPNHLIKINNLKVPHKDWAPKINEIEVDVAKNH